MTRQHSLHDLLHGLTHRIAGVPPHAERPAGHQGTARHHHHHARQQRRGNHSSARPPRVLVTWQRRIAALFGQEP
ncbi:hypothetical protein [Nonomuraea sp. NPDC002799]